MRRLRSTLATFTLLVVPAGGAFVHSTPAAHAAHSLERPVRHVRADPRAGAFCRTADAGKVVTTGKGDVLRCDTAPGDARYRWRSVK